MRSTGAPAEHTRADAAACLPVYAAVPAMQGTISADEGRGCCVAIRRQDGTARYTADCTSSEDSAHNLQRQPGNLELSWRGQRPALL